MAVQSWEIEFHRKDNYRKVVRGEEDGNLSNQSPMTIERKESVRKRVLSEDWGKMIHDLKKDAMNEIRKDIRREISQEIKKEMRKDWGRTRSCNNKSTKKKVLDANVVFASSGTDQNIIRTGKLGDQLSFSMDTWDPFTKDDSNVTKNEIDNNGQ